MYLGDNMLCVSENIKNKYKYYKCKVYTKEPITEGCECFFSKDCIKYEKRFTEYINTYNIKHKNGKFYFTNEDLSNVADWWPKHMLPIIGAYVSSNKGNKKNKKRKNSFIVDVSALPAFNGSMFENINEDVSVHEYRLYITLFNNYTVKQCQFDRFKLYDAKFNSSKYDLTAKIQSSDFLKSKDFTVINVKRKTDENVLIGIIIKSPENNEYSNEYGKLYIDMENKVSIIWC